MAQIIKKKEAFLIRITKARDDTGKRIYVYKTVQFSDLTAKTPKAMEKEVKTIADNLEQQVKSGKYYDGNKMTFKEFQAVWSEEWAFNNIGQTQIENYEDAIRTKAFPYIGDMKLDKIQSIHIQKIINDMMQMGYSPKTVRSTITAVRSIFKYAYHMNIISENPCDRCQLPKLENTDKDMDTDEEELHYFTVEQAQIFLNALTQTYKVPHKAHSRKNVKTKQPEDVKDFDQTITIPFQWRVYFALAIYGGFRRAEIVSLTWNDIDFTQHTIKIRKGIARTRKYGELIKKPKTAKGKREIMLPEVCFDLLAEWYKQEVELCKTLGSAWQGEPLENFENTWIFITSDGSRMCVDSPTKRFRTILDMYNSMIDEQIAECTDALERERLNSLKLPIIRLHDLRHTSATLLLSEGVDIETVSRRIGHSRASVTLDIYGHAMKHKDTEASDTLTRIFNAVASKPDEEQKHTTILN